MSQSLPLGDVTKDHLGRTWLRLTREQWLSEVAALKAALPGLIVHDVTGICEPPLERVHILQADGLVGTLIYTCTREFIDWSSDAREKDLSHPGKFWKYEKLIGVDHRAYRAFMKKSARGSN